MPLDPQWQYQRTAEPVRLPDPPFTTQVDPEQSRPDRNFRARARSFAALVAMAPALFFVPNLPQDVPVDFVMAPDATQIHEPPSRAYLQLSNVIETGLVEAKRLEWLPQEPQIFLKPRSRTHLGQWLALVEPLSPVSVDLILSAPEAPQRDPSGREYLRDPFVLEMDRPPPPDHVGLATNQAPERRETFAHLEEASSWLDEPPIVPPSLPDFGWYQPASELRRTDRLRAHNSVARMPSFWFQLPIPTTIPTVPTVYTRCRIDAIDYDRCQAPTAPEGYGVEYGEHYGTAATSFTKNIAATVLFTKNPTAVVSFTKNPATTITYTRTGGA